MALRPRGSPPRPVYNIISCPSRETHTWKERKTEKDRVEEKKGGRGGGEEGGRGHRYPVTTPPLGNVPPNPFEKLNYGESAK